KDFAVGVAIGIGMERSFREDDLELAADGFGGSLLLAYHAALGSNVFLLPELGLGASYRRRTVEGPSIPFTLATGRLVQLPTPPVEHSAPVLHASFSLPAAILLAPRFYLGAGPYVQVEWGDALATPRGDDLRIAIGLSTLFGTWL
ncbi:MAG TPA: hypothetical protein VJR89_06360, partial [Polyangiales bacterium]|nr:hypothetical protein [Polyangiales bacterium]